MAPNPDIERWLAERRPHAASVMRRVHDVVLAADERVTAYLKNGTLHFGYGGDLAAFVKLDRRPSTLMFYRGARIAGDHPHLEGDGPTARFMRFADEAEVDERARELASIVAAWCALMAPDESESEDRDP